MILILLFLVLKMGDPHGDPMGFNTGSMTWMITGVPGLVNIQKILNTIEHGPVEIVDLPIAKW